MSWEKWKYDYDPGTTPEQLDRGGFCFLFLCRLLAFYIARYTYDTAQPKSLVNSLNRYYGDPDSRYADLVLWLANRSKNAQAALALLGKSGLGADAYLAGFRRWGQSALPAPVLSPASASGPPQSTSSLILSVPTATFPVKTAILFILCPKAALPFPPNSPNGFTASSGTLTPPKSTLVPIPTTSSTASWTKATWPPPAG